MSSPERADRAGWSKMSRTSSQHLLGVWDVKGPVGLSVTGNNIHKNGPDRSPSCPFPYQSYLSSPSSGFWIWNRKESDFTWRSSFIPEHHRCGGNKPLAHQRRHQRFRLQQNPCSCSFKTHSGRNYLLKSHLDMLQFKSMLNLQKSQKAKNETRYTL